MRLFFLLLWLESVLSKKLYYEKSYATIKTQFEKESAEGWNLLRTAKAHEEVIFIFGLKQVRWLIFDLYHSKLAKFGQIGEYFLACFGSTTRRLWQLHRYRANYSAYRTIRRLYQVISDSSNRPHHSSIRVHFYWRSHGLCSESKPRLAHLLYAGQGCPANLSSSEISCLWPTQ